jgi:hypothetical protein
MDCRPFTPLDCRPFPPSLNFGSLWCGIGPVLCALFVAPWMMHPRTCGHPTGTGGQDGYLQARVVGSCSRAVPVWN